MNALQLSQKQRSQLLELTRAIFPEWFEIIWGKKYAPSTEYLWFSTSWEHPVTKVVMPTLEKEIHWYEFCLTHLCQRLQSKIPFRTSTGSLTYQADLKIVTLTAGEHPVDFLYKEAKKHKLIKEIIDKSNYHRPVDRLWG